MKAKIDNFSKEELAQIVSDCTSKRELLKKLGYVSIGSNFETIQRRLDEYNISIEHFTRLKKGNTIRTEENVFCEDSTASQATLRRWYIQGNYTEYKCSICGQPPIWNNKPLTLTLDHINGKNHDNRLQNLRWICPNCDRQLDTFAGKNVEKENNYNFKEAKKNQCLDCGVEISITATRCIACQAKTRRKIDRPSLEELQQFLIKEKGNFTKVAQFFGVTDNAIRKWCKNYNLPFHSKDYKI